MNPIEELIRTNVEFIGYLGSLFVLISFVYEGWRLRVWNSIGASLWLFYGVLQDSGSIILLNSCILGLHLRKLSIESRGKRNDKKSFGNDRKKNFKKPTRS